MLGIIFILCTMMQNVEHLALFHGHGRTWGGGARGAEAPQFVGQTKPVGQYSLHNRAILAYYKNKWDKFCQFCGKCCQFCGKYAI